MKDTDSSGRPISASNPQFPSSNKALASDQNPNALDSDTEEELDGSATVKQIRTVEDISLKTSRADPERNSRMEELQLEKEILILKVEELKLKGNQELEVKKLDIEKLKLDKEMLTLKNEGDERQRNHDKEMLELKNRQDSEQLKSTHNHEKAMKETDLKIETFKMSKLKIEADEKRRHEEKQQQLNIEADVKRRHEEQQLSNHRYLLATTLIGTGAAAGAGAVIGPAFALTAAVGAAAATAPIAIPIAVASGICLAINKLRPTSSS